MTTPVSSLSLSLRASNALADAGIETAETIAEMGYKKLLLLPHMGPTCAKEVWPQVQHLSKKMVKVRLRVVVYRHPEPDSYGYYVDLDGAIGAPLVGAHVVWIEADVPAEPAPVPAKVVGD